MSADNRRAFKQGPFQVTINKGAAVETLIPETKVEYQRFVLTHAGANYCHDVAWSAVIEETYGCEPVYFLYRSSPGGSVDGVLPAFYLRNSLLGRQMVSLPYLDSGGILAKNGEVEAQLLRRFLEEASLRRANSELRCTERLSAMEPPLNEKVGMSVDLEGLDVACFWKQLDGKARNQVRKAEKSKVELRWGRHELLDDFYGVFSRNMRDLGSPVHSRRLFGNAIDKMPGTEIGTAYREGCCIAGLVRILWRDTLAIPWASSLREERVHCPNNALYWDSVRFAFHSGCRRVDLGRSTRGEGTYRFKLQWTARETPLPWYQFDNDGALIRQVQHPSSGNLARLSRLWAKLPLPIANALGPQLRPLISA